ncbi:MAG: class I SAM-dependent methyltransferase [Patescibacteria group bacterium]|jgi:SAM-dependent methyltransferase
MAKYIAESRNNYLSLTKIMIEQKTNSKKTLSLLHKYYILIRNIRYKEYIDEIEKIKNAEYADFSSFSGIRKENFAKCIDQWNNYISKNKIDYNNLDKYYSNCNTITNIEDQYSRVNLYKVLKESIKSLNKKINYLDFGCGSGSLSFNFIKFFQEGYFLDFHSMSQEFLKYRINLNKDCRNNLHILEPQEIDKIKNNSLDIVLIYDVLEHLPNPSATLKKISSKIKIGGFIVFRAPWGDTFFGKHPDHNIFSRKEMIKNGGMKLLKEKYAKIKSVCILDYYYKQGVFQKII